MLAAGKKKKKNYYEEAHQTQPTNRRKKKSKRRGQYAKSLFHILHPNIVSFITALQHEGLHFKSKAMILPILIDGPLIWFYGLSFSS